jgi:thiol-disulfide isomerase/thioredoxin
MLVDIRKVIAVMVVSVAVLVLGVQFMRMVRPAAAREVAAACRGLKPAPKNASYSQFPATAKAVSLQDHEGKKVSLTDYRGKVVLVNFWASWCGVCKSEKPSLKRLQRDLGGDDFTVLALASDKNWDAVKKSLPKGTPFKVLLDPPPDDGNLGAVARAFGITAVPESFLIDKRGVVRRYFINKRNWNSDVAKTCIRALMDE